MRKKNSFNIAAFIVLLSTISTACTDFEKEIQVAYGDAFIKSVQISDSVVAYNLELFAYSWSEMDKVEVYQENSQDIFVLDTFDYKYTFKLQTDENFISGDLPDSGQYFFDITFADGEYFQVSDFLMNAIINPPIITLLEWNSLDESVTIEWGKVDNADLYSVMLLDESNAIVYETEMLDNTYGFKRINSFTYGWQSDKIPTKATKLRLVVSAYLFEPVSSSFDIQCIAINELHTFIWEPGTE